MRLRSPAKYRHGVNGRRVGRSQLLRRASCLILLLLSTGTLYACKVPVFRYALERWNTDHYTVVVMLDEASESTASEALELLKDRERVSHANLEVEFIRIDQLTDQQVWQLESFDPEVQTPHFQVFYPERDGRRKLCWEGGLDRETAEQWLESPLRNQIRDDLVAGASAVWLLVDSDDASLNAEVKKTLEDGLELAREQIQIPDGVIPRDGASDYLKANPESSMDDVLRSDVPLKVEFVVRSLRRDDEQELAIRQMVAGMASKDDVPLLVPIFGRGRMLDAIDASSLTTDTVLSACRYMVGECSCTVKTQNPGVDMLLHSDWSEALGAETLVLVETQLDTTPELIEIPTGEIALPSANSITTGWGRAAIAGTVAVGSVVVGLLALSVARRRHRSGA